MFLLNSYIFGVISAAVNPVIRAASYTDQSGGDPDLVSPQVEYTDLGGADSLTVYGATGTNPVTVSKAQLKAGSGGTNTLEFFSYAYNAGTDSDTITGLTATSNAANRIVFYVEEDNNGGTSDIETVTVSGLDFTAPSAPTAATNTAGNAITLTFAEAVYGTQDAADFVVSGAGVTTVSAVTGFGTSTLVLTLAGTGVARGNTVTLAYTETDSEIRDANGNALANFSGLAVTNNAGVSTIVINSIGPQATDVPVAYDIDINDSTVEAVLFLSTDPNPTAADFNTGATSGYIDLGQVALTTAGSGINLAVPAGLSGTYKLALLPTGGGTPDIAVSAAFALVTAVPGFRATNNAEQTGLASAPAEVAFQTEIFDLGSNFASNRFTVPAGLDGEYMSFVAGIKKSEAITVGGTDTLSIEKSTDGSVWSKVSTAEVESGANIVTATGPILVAGGEIYRALVDLVETVSDSDRTFFAGRPVTTPIFRATTSTTQSLTAATTTEVNFGTEVFDIDGTFASNHFTVPAGMNGKYGSFYAGLKLASDTGGLYIAIATSTDGGSVWTAVADFSTENSAINVGCSTGPVLLTTGHKYRVTVYVAGSGEIITDADTCFFAGEVNEFSGFRAVANGTQAVSATTTTGVTAFGTEAFDTDGVFASNVVTIPVGLAGMYGEFFAGLRFAAVEDSYLWIEKSTDGGSTWASTFAGNNGSQQGVNVCSGPVLLAEGDKYRVAVYTATGSTISNDARTFFAGQFFAL